jgi:hypothetical protein
LAIALKKEAAPIGGRFCDVNAATAPIRWAFPRKGTLTAMGQLHVSHDAVLARLIFREEAFLPVSERLHGLVVNARCSYGS